MKKTFNVELELNEEALASYNAIVAESEKALLEFIKASGKPATAVVGDFDFSKYSEKLDKAAKEVIILTVNGNSVPLFVATLQESSIGEEFEAFSDEAKAFQDAQVEKLVAQESNPETALGSFVATPFEAGLLKKLLFESSEDSKYDICFFTLLLSMFRDLMSNQVVRGMKAGLAPKTPQEALEKFLQSLAEAAGGEVDNADAPADQETTAPAEGAEGAEGTAAAADSQN